MAKQSKKQSKIPFATEQSILKIIKQFGFARLHYSTACNEYPYAYTEILPDFDTVSEIMGENENNIHKYLHWVAKKFEYQFGISNQASVDIFLGNRDQIKLLQKYANGEQIQGDDLEYISFQHETIFTIELSSLSEFRGFLEHCTVILDKTAQASGDDEIFDYAPSAFETTLAIMATNRKILKIWELYMEEILGSDTEKWSEFLEVHGTPKKAIQYYLSTVQQ